MYWFKYTSKELNIIKHTEGETKTTRGKALLHEFLLRRKLTFPEMNYLSTYCSKAHLPAVARQKEIRH